MNTAVSVMDSNQGVLIKSGFKGVLTKFCKRQEGFTLWHKNGENCKNHMKNTIFSNFFEQIACEPKCDSLAKKSKMLPLLFFHDRPEQIAQCFSFVKSNRSESLTVALLFRAT